MRKSRAACTCVRWFSSYFHFESPCRRCLKMYELARKALILAEKAGAEEAEIYYNSSHSTSVNFKKDALESAKDRFSEGIGIRAIVNGAVGFASTNSARDLENAVEIAVAEARIRENDPEWIGLPSNGK